MMFLFFVVYLRFRFTLPPSDLWDWFESYLDDEEVRKAGLKCHTHCCMHCF